MKCDFDPEAMRCRRCGAAVSSIAVRRNCCPGLGDIVAAGLSAVGITKQRVEALVGGPCGCAERQEALNALGRSLGIGRVDPPA